MSKIRGRGNRDTEVAFARILRKEHITGWRRQFPILGRPDFAFPKTRVAVFVDGCFWHSCPKCGNTPVHNRMFWKRKLAANTRRDRSVSLSLRRQGWKVLRIWEHDLKRPMGVVRRIRRLLQPAGAPHQQSA